MASLGVSGKWRVFVSCSIQKLHRNFKKYNNVLYRKRWFIPVILVEFELVLFVPSETSASHLEDDEELKNFLP